MYTVNVKGIDGVFTATLTFNGVHVDEEAGFGSIKAADRWASSRAKLHSEISRPAELVSHARSFTL